MLKLIQSEKRLDTKRDMVMLLANTVEVDSTEKLFQFYKKCSYRLWTLILELAFEGMNLTDLYKFLSESLVTHDSEKERAELMKLELQKMNEQAALRRKDTLFGEDTSDVMTDVTDHQVDVVMKDAEQQKAEDNNDEEAEEDEDMPWPLSLLSYLMQFGTSNQRSNLVNARDRCI